MITLNLAQQLKAAGLPWQPTLHDFFAVPDAGLDDRVFVISDMMAEAEIMRGWPTITFHGSVEWALDYVLQTEAVWMPTETQLRNLLLDTIGEADAISLTVSADAATCRVTRGMVSAEFNAADAPTAYAYALLAYLR